MEDFKKFFSGLQRDYGFCNVENGYIDPDSGKLIVTHFYYLKEGSSGDEFVKRNYPNGKTIAEFRVEGNAVVEPSIANTKLFDERKVERQWNKQGKLDRSTSILE